MFSFSNLPIFGGGIGDPIEESIFMKLSSSAAEGSFSIISDGFTAEGLGTTLFPRRLPLLFLDGNDAGRLKDRAAPVKLLA
jgi:hypothetical protein